MKLLLPRWENRSRKPSTDCPRSGGRVLRHAILTEDLGMYRGLSEVCAKALDWRAEHLTLFNLRRSPTTREWGWTFLVKRHHRRGYLSLWVWRWNITTVITMEMSWFAAPQEKKNTALECGNSVGLFFDYRIMFVFNSFHQAGRLIKRIIRNFWNV